MKTLALLSLAGLVSAQAAPYAQCGGSGYSGSTTCVSGWACEYQNDWFSQCLACKCAHISCNYVQSINMERSSFWR